MKFRDLLVFLLVMTKTELKRIKRLFYIIFLSSFLVFVISNFVSITQNWIHLKYKNRYVLMPFHKITHKPAASLKYPLVNLEQINNPSFKDIHIELSKPKQLILVHQLESNFHETVSFSYEDNSSKVLISESLLEFYNLKINDFFRINALVFKVEDIQNHNETDLVFPSYYKSILGPQKESYDNFITVMSDDIETIIKIINNELQYLSYYYEKSNIDSEAILNTLVKFFERILISISLLIFIVSSSNIGTIMPYFMNEFKDEIRILRLHGLYKKHIKTLFTAFAFSLLFFSLNFAYIFSIIFTIPVSYLLNVSFNIINKRVLILSIFQLFLGITLSIHSIEKATEEVAYL